MPLSLIPLAPLPSPAKGACCRNRRTTRRSSPSPAAPAAPPPAAASRASGPPCPPAPSSSPPAGRRARSPSWPASSPRAASAPARAARRLCVEQSVGAVWMISGNVAERQRPPNPQSSENARTELLRQVPPLEPLQVLDGPHVVVVKAPLLAPDQGPVDALRHHLGVALVRELDPPLHVLLLAVAPRLGAPLAGGLVCCCSMGAVGAFRDRGSNTAPNDTVLPARGDGMG